MGDSNSPGILQRKILGTGRKKSRNLDNVDKSLACFASALQGSPIIVELRNSTFVRGTLYMSDTFMKYDFTAAWIQDGGLHAVLSASLTMPRLILSFTSSSLIP